MSYIGIDFDTHAVHLLELLEEGSVYTCRPLTGADAFERLRSVRGAMPRSSFWDDVIAVGIEEPQGAQKATVAKLKAVQGAIVACIPRNTLVEPMVPARWRTIVGLSGRASKDEVRQFVEMSTAAYFPKQDACDAFCIALAVSRLVMTEEAA